jgi:endonuclease-3 related protein
MINELDNNLNPLRSHLLEIYNRLRKRYGVQHWWSNDEPFEIIVGAILAQNTAWRNVELALNNLKVAEIVSPSQLRQFPMHTLENLLRPSRYFRSKARYLKAFVYHLEECFENDLSSFLSIRALDLRRELLSIKGIGEETADDILLYAAGHPFFVIDAFTKRILSRLGITPTTNRYHDFQKIFHQNLPLESKLFNEYHALLDRHAAEVCRPTPLCKNCPLLDICPTGDI